MDKSNLYQFAPEERIIMPRSLAKEIESRFKNGSISPELEEIYRIVREECSEYKHADNSNARKFLTARAVLTIKKNKKGEGRKIVVRRKIPVTAVMKIVDLARQANRFFS
jgi:hypothetical protein